MKAMMLAGIREMEMRDVPTPSIRNDHDGRAVEGFRHYKGLPDNVG